MQRSVNNDNFTQLMLLLGTKTRNAIKDILLRFGLEITVVEARHTMVPAICWERKLALEHEFCLYNASPMLSIAIALWQ